MKTGTKIFLIIVAIVCILSGSAIFTNVLAKNGWDFSTVNYETKEHSVTEEFQDIKIETETANLSLLASEDETCKVVCYEMEKVTHTVSVEEGVLKIQVEDEREWYEHIGIFTENQEVTVYLPKSEYGNLNIKNVTGDVEISKDFSFANMDIQVTTGNVSNFASSLGEVNIDMITGNVKMENISANALSLRITTGDVTLYQVDCIGTITMDMVTGDTYLTEVTCEGFVSEGTTGKIVLKNTLATKEFSIERVTGDVRFESCDAEEIVVETTSGDISGTLRSDKVFVADSLSGSVRVPNTTSGGKCTINTTSGDITIQIENV